MPELRDSIDVVVREVYARFGLAYYLSECLHRNLSFVAALGRLPRQDLVTRPRYDEELAKAFSKTLGELFAALQQELPAEFEDRLKGAVDIRNFLAHHFWYQRAHLMMNEDGLGSLISELDGYVSQFERLNADVRAWSRPLLFQHGLTEAAIEEAVEEVLTGSDGPELPDKHQLRSLDQKLKSRQWLRRVWRVPVDGFEALVFELSDGSMWQLSDVGLGPTHFTAAASDWMEHEAVNQHLPAEIVPRPQCVRPWEYEFRLSRGAVLWVKPEAKAGACRWGFRRE